MLLMQDFLLPFQNIDLLLLVAAGTFAGIIIGAIPGLSVTMAVALLISLTYSWDLLPALALMIGVYFGGVFGGSRAAILINIPGAPASVATTFDGYPLAQKGEARTALTLTTISSFIGGLVGVLVLSVAAPLVSSIAIQFGQRDYFLMSIMGLLLVGGLSKGALSKGIFTAGLGVVISFIGMDPMNGSPRFTFGSLQLMNGINFVVAILGLFGLAEILFQLGTMEKTKVTSTIKKSAIVPFRLIIKLLPLSLRVSLLGVLVGALPGAGGEIAALLSYDHAKRSVKKPNRPFGEGAYEGVVAPEAANNAAIGGALIPLLTLGIPGDSVTAIFLGALYIHGLQPGPLLMQQSSDIFGIMLGSSLLANIFLLIFGLALASIFIKVVTVPKQILLPIVTVITVIGAYSINNSLTDVYWMIGFGLFGYLLKLYHFPVAPLVLGIILGPLMETSFRRAYMSSRSLGEFFIGFVESPISLMLSIAFVFILVSQILGGRRGEQG